MIKKLRKIYYTVISLKIQQIVFQIVYRLRNKMYKLKPIRLTTFENTGVQYDYVIKNKTVYDKKAFTFLNKTVVFDEINWNESKYGKLWTYNLNYFDFLNQDSMKKNTGLELIKDFCSKKQLIKDGFEPYPISLRVINWVKFLSKHRIKNEQIDQQLINDLYRLNSKIEYHILANHLFENGFGLLFGAYYFRDEKLYKKAFKIITTQLKEQILPDGAHYELTPMYHQIILHRILDSIQLISKNDWKGNLLLEELTNAASKMLGWMNAMNFSGNCVPKVNDTTSDISANPVDLLSYSNQLKLEPSSIKLKESGYRKLTTVNLELLFDVGQISPSYQPGHSHADSLQILVNKNSQEILVDTGISTYEKNKRRQIERSTSSHNTITVNNENSSDVWSGFRVGKRAQTILKEDGVNLIKAEHNGYRSKKITVSRSVEKVNHGIHITDEVISADKKDNLVGHLHFHPSLEVSLREQNIYVNGELFITFNSPCMLDLSTYEHCLSFNNTTTATKATYAFKEKCSFTLN